MQCRISTVGQERREIDFESGETLGQVFDRSGIELPGGAGIEVWVNGDKKESWHDHRLENGDSVVLVPNVKGAKFMHLTFRQK